MTPAADWEFSAFLRVIDVISSVEEKVCSKDAACSDAPCARDWLDDATCPAALQICSALCASSDAVFQLAFRDAIPRPSVTSRIATKLPVNFLPNVKCEFILSRRALLRAHSPYRARLRGLESRRRRLKRNQLLIAQDSHRVEPRGAIGRDTTRGERHQEQHCGDARECKRVQGANGKEHFGQVAGEECGGDQS